MEIETHDSSPEERRADRIRQWIELLSAVMLALATVATAWSAYQSARWGGEQSRHVSRASAANTKVAKFANLAEQRFGLHVSLFGQWFAAVATDNKALAEFAFSRLPEPLKTATAAWQSTQPLTNAGAPATPFNMPEYVLAENDEMTRWEAVSDAETEAAEEAGEISDRYLLFTIIFASVLFFGGISGKCRWQLIDIGVLVFGALAFVGGLAVVFSNPIK